MLILFFHLLLLIKVFIGVPLKSKKLDIHKKYLRKINDLSDDIVIVHLNDVHCGIQDKVGYDGFVLYLDKLKEKYKYVITVDVGDHIQGGSLGAISNGEAIIKIMNKINFDVVTIGNHEFDYGTEQLDKLGKNISSKYICVNYCYKKNKTCIFEPYKIIEAGNKKIGFLGVLTPLTLTKTYLSTLKESDGSAIYDFLSGNDTELQQTLQNHINKLRNEEKVDYVILLTHIGMDLEKYTSNGLLSNLEGVDAVLDGHTHLVYNTTTKDKTRKNIPISQTGTKLESIGKLILKTDGSIETETISEVPEPSNTTGAKNVTRSGVNRWVDEGMYNFIGEIWDEYEEELNTVVGKSDYDLITKPENASSNQLIYCRYQECTLGNLIADAVTFEAKSDFTIVNAGGVRGNLYTGNITKANVIEIIPWFNNIFIKRVTGQTVLDALEFGVRNYPSSSGQFPQVSSELSFDIDPSINSTVQTDRDGIFINITGARRVSNVKVNGEDLVLDKIYNISLFEIIANGGGGFQMFADIEVSREAAITDTDAVALYIQNNLNGSIPKKYSEIQGRINIVNSSSTTTTPEITISTTISNENSTVNAFTPYFRKRSNKGLSAGGIIAIVISCVVALIITAIVAIICKSSPNSVSLPQDSKTFNIKS